MSGPVSGPGLGTPIAQASAVSVADAKAINSGTDISVAPAQVLAVASLFEDQLNVLEKEFNANLGTLTISDISADKVSKSAISAWNQLIAGNPDSYSSRVKLYLESLRTVINQLRDAAKTYQLSDDDKANALKQIHPS